MNLSRACRSAAAALCAAAALLPAAGVFARPWSEIKLLNEISVCANPNAPPYSSDRPDSPGFQIETARAIAGRLGLRLRIDWIVPRMRAATVDCDLLMDSIVVPGVQPPSLRLSIPYHRSGVSLAFGRGHEPAVSYRDLKQGTRVGVLMNSLASLVVSRTPAAMVPFGFEDDMLDAVARGDVAAGAATAASIGYFNMKHPDTPLTLVHAEDAEPELRWSVAVGMRRADDALVQNVNGALSALLAEGAIAAIYSKYGIPHRKP